MLLEWFQGNGISIICGQSGCLGDSAGTPTERDRGSSKDKGFSEDKGRSIVGADRMNS